MATIISSKTTGGGGLAVTGDSSGILQLASADGTTAVTIDASQNVGIGTSSPASYGKLAVSVPATASAVTNVLGVFQSTAVDNASLRFSGYRYTGATQTAIDFIQNSSSNFQSNIAFSTDSGGGMSERMRINSTGQMVMGGNTAYSSAKVTLIPLANPTTGTSASSQIQIGEALGNSLYKLNIGYGLFGDYYGYIQSQNNGTANPLLLNPDGGNVLVGTTASLYSIPQGVAMSGSTIGAIVVGHASGVTTGNGYINFNYNTGAIGSITQSGTTAVLYNTTSDYRLKTNATPIQNALITIEELNPVSFTWIDGRPDDGFLAHELQAVIPNCVTGEKDAVNEDGTPKYQQMDNSGVVPFLVKAIQELKAIIDLQATRISALEAK